MTSSLTLQNQRSDDPNVAHLTLNNLARFLKTENALKSVGLVVVLILFVESILYVWTFRIQ